MKAPSTTALRGLQVALGAMDCLTGILLMAAPARTLSLMGINREPVEPVMVSWIGAFVFGVGASYFFVFSGPAAGWRMQWKLTALLRVVIGAFVTWKLVSRELEPAWVTVAVTDLVVAAIQVLGLRLGWLNGRRAQ